MKKLIPVLLLVATYNQAMVKEFLNMFTCNPTSVNFRSLDEALAQANKATKLALMCHTLSEEDIKSQESEILKEPRSIKKINNRVYTAEWTGGPAFLSYLTAEEILHEKRWCRTEGCAALKKLFDKANSEIKNQEKEELLK